MSEKLGVVVAGYGFMGNTHMTAWSMISEARILGVVARHRERAEEIAKKYDAGVFADLRSALKETDAEAVDLCTPTHTHRSLAVEVAEAGKHILCEKPLALSLKDADMIIEAAKKAKVKLMVAHCIRFFAEYVKVKELVKQGAIGDPVIARAHRAGPLPQWGTENWFTDQDKSGGVAVDLAIHDIDFLRWCFEDEVQRVYAVVGRLVRKDVTADDHALMILRFKRGGIAHVEASWAVPEQYPFTTYLEIAGTKGFLNVDNNSTVPVTVMSRGKVERFSPDTRPWIPGMPFPIDPYLSEIRHFVDCILGDKEPMTSGKEARSSLEVALAAVESSIRGSPVSLPWR